MSSDYRDRQVVLASNICGLLCCLTPSTYDEVAPKIEYWIEYVLSEQFMTTDDLAERISAVAWESHGSHPDISRFLKEFRDAPHRSEQARSFVDRLCLYLLRWFAVASAEDFCWTNWHKSSVSKSGGPGFIRAASFVGHLIECGLLSDEPVRRHIFKPLTSHYYNPESLWKQSVRANAIYKLFTAAGHTLLQGLLEPEEVQDCFKNLEARVPLGDMGGIDTWDATRLNEFREIYTAWLQRRVEEEQRNPTVVEVVVEEAAEEQRNLIVAEVPVEEVETPVAPPAQDLPPTHIGVDSPSFAFQELESLSLFQGVGFHPDTVTDIRASTVSSPTLSISTVSDWTPTELGEIEEDDGKRIPTRHETFYLEDGNVEIVCEHTIFRVHSPIISFSSPNLRDMLSSSTLLSAPMPEGCPRIVFKDSAQDFAVLLKMIYTPGFPARHKVPEFTTFTSLLRMATKYGFSDIRDGLIEDLKDAYPTKWEDFETAKVLGEDVFGSPKPHPNAVLNLLSEQRVKFALPFAAYRAAMGGFSSLISDESSTVLPRPTLASTIYGIERIRCTMVQFSHSIVYSGHLGVCPREECVLNVGINPIERRMEALKKIFGIMVDKSKGDLLSPLPLGDLVCVDCAKLLDDAHLHYREKFVWRALPSLLAGAGAGSVTL